ncbi:kinesin [Diplodia corticola]|uniref:Kinesin n=1 Tax=Diplodia corticola TaxID=236234 RepID=A0A1J9RJZ8_9PEZI|nr:kinesin [Diplodia corticola]OJD32899.1 kinesin [Diplodia corticola]
MASSSDDGRILLYYQQTKREHQYLKKKTEQFTESLRKVDTMYEAMLEHELRMNDMDQRLTALTEDNNSIKELFRKMGSDEHGRFEKASLEVQNLSRKVLRVETLEKEHSNRVHNNGILLRDIQYKLAQLEETVEELPKSKGKATKHPDHSEIGRLAKEVESLRGLLYEQGTSAKKLRQDFDEVKAVVQQGGEGIAQARAQTREPNTQPRPRSEPETQSSAQPQTPTSANVKKPAKRRQPVHSTRLSKRQTIISSKGSEKPTHTPSLALDAGSRGLPMARISRHTDTPIPGRLRVSKERSPVSKAPSRRSQRISEKNKRQASSQPQVEIALDGYEDAGPRCPPSQRPLMVHMNHSYPHIQGLPRSSESGDAIGTRSETEQRAASRLSGWRQDQEYQDAPAERSAQHENYPRKPPALVPQPRKRKKRELPPMKPLPPYEE